MLDKLFTEATQAHSVNDLDLAEKLYLKILNKYPRESKTLFLIGTLYIQKKIYKKAINYLLKAHDIDSSNDHLLMNLGIAYKANHDFIKSELMFKHALNINPKNADTLNNLGNLYFENNKHELAIDYFKRAIASNKNDEAYIINLAESLAITGDFKAAIDYLVAIKPASNLFFESQLRLFSILFKSKNYENCIVIGEKLLTKNLISSDVNHILNNLIHASIELNDFQRARSFFLKLPKQDKNYLFNKALIHSANGDIDDALSCYETLIKQNINIIQSLHNMGLLYFKQCNVHKAIETFNSALKINSNLPETKKILGICQLSQCNFKSGWSNFLNYQKNLLFNCSFLKNKIKWNGFDINKSILIVFDQGIGDQIFYASMLDRLEQNNRYICLVDIKLKELFKKSFSNLINFISLDEVDKIQFDQYVRGSDLTSFYIKDVDDLKKQKPYLRATKYNFKERNIIGISWHSANKFIGKQKSIELKKLIKKLKHKSSYFLSLQYGNFIYELKKLENSEKISFINSSDVDNFNDIEGLAGLIMACDEIYTISNTTAHLAGALGVKVNLILPFDHHTNTWYWFSKSNNKSLWYPNVNIFKANPGTPISTALDLIA